MSEAVAAQDIRRVELDRPYYLDLPDPRVCRGWERLKVHPEIARNTLRVALPVVFGMVTQSAVNILATVMVGRLPAELANPGQAAIGFSLPIMWLVGGSLSAIWVGTQAIAARRNGAGEHELAGQALTNSFILGLITSTVLSGLAIWSASWLLPLLHRDPASAALGVDYVQIRLAGVVAMVTTFSLKSFFDGIGRTHYFMTAAIIMNVLNVVLNALLIFGNPTLGIPRLGVSGAAWASVVSAYIGLFILASLALRPSLVRRYRYLRLSNLTPRILREIAVLSFPNAIATIVVMVGFSGFYWVVGQVNDQVAPPGNPYVAAASQAVVTLNMVGFMTALAFGSATASLVGQSLGARRVYLGERYGWEAAKLWAYVLGAFGLLVFAIPDACVAAINPDPQVIEAARDPVRLMAALQAVIAVAMVFAQTLYGVGDASFVMVVELVLHLGVMAPGAYLFGVVLELGLVGVYLGPAIYACALAAATLLRFKRGAWKQVKI